VGKKYARPNDPKEFQEIPVAAAPSEQLADALEQEHESDDGEYREPSSPTDTTTEGSSSEEDDNAVNEEQESEEEGQRGDDPSPAADEEVAEEEPEGPEIFDEEAERIDPEYTWETGEYNSYLHALTHLPRKVNCPSCQLAKMKERYSRRGACKRVLGRFGELLTFDHIYSKRKESIGLNGET
jgi:hypothetical protein